jgi:hypothetical protein
VAAANAGPGSAGRDDASFGARLTAARTAVGELAAAADRLGDVADDGLASVMAELTTLVGQLDGLRVAVTAHVRDRGVFRRQGAASVAGWLRADVRTADVAWSLSRLAARSAELPRITGLLTRGAASLAQAGAACWQVVHLPDVPRRPGDGDERAALLDPAPGNDLWGGLWCHGDVRAAADELFAGYMPRLDSAGLRVLGAHLREAADAQERAEEDYDAFAQRTLRLSRSLGGVGELSGRLHPEAAEQVLAAFEQLGVKAGPDDPRTKAQRWADVLVYLTGLAEMTSPAGGAELADTGNVTAARTAGRTRPGTEPEDDQPSPDGGHGHDRRPQAGNDTSGGVEHAHAKAGPTRLTALADGPGVAPPGLRRPRVIVTVPLSTLLGQPLSPGAVLGAGTPITGEAARRLACDADLIRLITGPPGLGSGPPGPSPGSAGVNHGPPGVNPGPAGGVPDPLPGERSARAGRDATGRLTELLAEVISGLPRPLGGPSAVLDIGRRSQSWTPRQRDALYAQYGGQCAASGCQRGIDVLHHIVHWAQGGRTTVANGVPFCNFHHWLVHEGGWRVTKGMAGGLVLIAPPPGWRPGTIYRRGKPLPETAPRTAA